MLFGEDAWPVLSETSGLFSPGEQTQHQIVVFLSLPSFLAPVTLHYFTPVKDQDTLKSTEYAVLNSDADVTLARQVLCRKCTALSPFL